LLFAGCATVTSPPPPPERPSEGAPGTRPYQINGKWYYPRTDAHGYRETGVASWYGHQFHGRKTANGEVYDMHAVSAAHKTLPFNTVVRVHNLDNGRTLTVRVNDRGPFVHGRIIDLSYGAAQAIGLVGPGTARVEVVALGKVAGASEPVTADRTYLPVNTDEGNFTFQVGAFRDPNNAERLRAKLDRVYQNAHVTTFESTEGLYYRVRVGRFTSLRDARRGEQMLIRDGYDPFIVAD
jgi:rare lipoprotein A